MSLKSTLIADLRKWQGEALKPENVRSERMVGYIDSLAKDGRGLKMFKTGIWVPSWVNRGPNWTLERKDEMLPKYPSLFPQQ